MYLSRNSGKVQLKVMFWLIKFWSGSSKYWFFHVQRIIEFLVWISMCLFIFEVCCSCMHSVPCIYEMLLVGVLLFLDMPNKCVSSKFCILYFNMIIAVDTGITGIEMPIILNDLDLILGLPLLVVGRNTRGLHVQERMVWVLMTEGNIPQADQSLLGVMVAVLQGLVHGHTGEILFQLI